MSGVTETERERYRGLMKAGRAEYTAGYDLEANAMTWSNPNPAHTLHTAAVRYAKSAELYAEASVYFTKNSVSTKEATRLARQSRIAATRVCDRIDKGFKNT